MHELYVLNSALTYLRTYRVSEVNVHEVSDERVLSGIVDTREFSSRFMALVAG